MLAGYSFGQLRKPYHRRYPHNGFNNHREHNILLMLQVCSDSPAEIRGQEQQPEDTRPRVNKQNDRYYFNYP